MTFHDWKPNARSLSEKEQKFLSPIRSTAVAFSKCVLQDTTGRNITYTTAKKASGRTDSLVVRSTSELDGSDNIVFGKLFNLFEFSNYSYISNWS